MTGAPVPIAQRIRLRENQLFLALTIIVGILAGLAAVLFTLSIRAAQRGLFGLEPSAARLILVPTVMSLVAGVLLAKLFPDARGSGIPQTEMAYHLRGGIIPLRTAFGKFLTGVICVGSGHSMGREGPSVHIGAGIASTIGQWTRLPPERVQSLVPVGAAGALAAAFNTPVAAVLFALEEIIGDMNAALLGSTVVASVAAVIVERSILGNEPLFHVPTYHLMHPAELAAYACLGIVGGAISLVFSQGLLHARRLFLSLPARTVIFRPAIGGLAIGILLVFVPEVMGVGYNYVGQALNGAMAARLMLILCAAKLVATIVSYSSGNAGGIFAPSLYLGAMAGGVVGTIVHQVAPFPTGDPGAYALVGMGTLFAGIIRAPMTSVFMIFEITQDYQILVPLMVANLLSFFIARQYQPTPIYHALLEQDQVHLPGPATRLASKRWRAATAMTTDVTFIPDGSSIEGAIALTASSGAATYPVGTPEKLAGLVTRAALERAIREGHGHDRVDAILSTDGPHVHGDHPLDVALERFSQSSGLLPVVDRSDISRVEGFITMDSIVRVLNNTRNDNG